MSKRLVYLRPEANVLQLAGSEGPTAQCYRLGDFVVMTGQAAFSLDGEFVGQGDAAAQTRQACQNITRLMELAGGSASDVVKIVVYITNRSHRAEVYPVIRSYFSPFPCSTGLVVEGLAREDMLVEIDAWGYIDESSGSH
jgi:enamine deaminase RidA (YjgF/YER057c/UK114 family)